MKQLVDALKAEPRNKEELRSVLQKDFPSKSPEAIRKQCDRALEKLQQLGLVKESSGEYYWYVYLNVFEVREDLSAKLLHSQNLVPALKRIAGICADSYRVEQQPIDPESKAYASIRDARAEDHLRAYANILPLYNAAKKNREKADSEEKQFIAQMSRKLAESFGESVVECNGRKRPESYVLDSIPSLVRTRIETREPIRVTVEDYERIWLGDTMIAKGRIFHTRAEKFFERETKEASNIETVHRILEIEKESFEAQLKLQPEMRKLIMRIEDGEPLLGKCDGCPRVYVRNDTRQKV